PLAGVHETDPRAPQWPPTSLQAIDSMSYRDLLASRGASDGAIDILRLGFSDLWGDGINACSALLLLRDDAFAAADSSAATSGTHVQSHPASHSFFTPQPPPASASAPPSNSPPAINTQTVY